MSTTIAGDKSLSLTSDESTVTQALDSLVESTDVDESELEPFLELIGGMAGTIEDLHDENRELRNEVEDNTQRLDGVSSWLDNVTDRVAVNEDSIDEIEDSATPNGDSDPKGTDGEDTTLHATVTPETPLEQTVSLPEEMVDSESANVQRACFIANDVMDYTTSVPAGRAITSSELRRVVKAGTDAKGHSQTIDRVIGILDDLGGDEVRVVERRGQRRIVFTDDIAQRLEELATDDCETSHTVVSQERT